MNSDVLAAWNATVSGAAQSNVLYVTITTLFIGSYLMLGAWLITGLFDAYKAKKINGQTIAKYLARWVFQFAIISFFVLAQ